MMFTYKIIRKMKVGDRFFIWGKFTGLQNQGGVIETGLHTIEAVFANSIVSGFFVAVNPIGTFPYSDQAVTLQVAPDLTIDGLFLIIGS